MFYRKSLDGNSVLIFRYYSLTFANRARGPLQGLLMLEAILRGIDWFIPVEIQRDKTELPVWRNFVFTHIAGPLFTQSISVFLWRGGGPPRAPPPPR